MCVDNQIITEKVIKTASKADTLFMTDKLYTSVANTFGTTGLVHYFLVNEGHG